MTLCFDGECLAKHLSHDVALRAMEECFAAEARGTTMLPPRIDTPSGKGLIRVMPAIFEDVMGLKVMTLVEDLGTRYLVLLYEVASGALLAIFDAEELTRLRTAAVTALAGRSMCSQAPESIGVVGSGFEAVGHLRMLAHMWPLKRVLASSPNAEHCKRFADAMADELGIDVIAADTADAAVRNQPCVVLATNSKAPVIDGYAISPGTVILSIGSTRLDRRELDDRSLERAAVVVADHEEAIRLQSADIAENLRSGTFDAGRILGLSRLVSGARLPPVTQSRDLLVFKSVGTALQDLALARAVYRDPTVQTEGVDIGEIAGLKPFSAKAIPAKESVKVSSH